MILHHQFIDSAKKYGRKVAVIDTATQKTYTYNQLLIAALIFANKLKHFPEKHIGIMIPSSAGCIISILGTQLAGKTPVMINFSTGAAQNTEYAQLKCSFLTFITSKKLCEKLNVPEMPGMIMIEDIIKDISPVDKVKAALMAQMPGSFIKKAIPPADENDDAVILFTSGSEKDPKAVQLSHKNIGHNLKGIPILFEIGSEDVFAGNLPYFHVFGLTVTCFLPLYLGGSIVTFANPLDYKQICDGIKKYQITMIVGTPTFFHGYLKKAEPGTFDSCNIMMAGADKLPNHLRNEYMNKHGKVLLEGYGTTETSPVISVNNFEFNKPGSIGKPMPGTQLKILHVDTEAELKANEVGKVLVKGDLVMKGYLGDYEQTKLHIRNGWYDTGDMGMIDDDGFLWHKGRLKRFVKIGGEMVSLVQVEAALDELLPEGTICCVVEIPNPVKGADIVAALTDKEIDFKKIQQKLRKVLPAIAIPKDFFTVDELPLMGSGKVNFREVERTCRILHNKRQLGKE
ncbi:MAG: AMP-binding protein [Candidatus Zophobacter franzmannii]|nr:AMP-binding protein [Candidatus Zophobacter franzmannii]